MSVDTNEIEKAVRMILRAIGEDETREGLERTPGRVARMWREFVEQDHGSIDTAFESVTADQMVVVSGMRVWSFCEHHLLPFWCDVSIGYIPNGKVLGLSKFARIARKFAHRLQIQERLVEQINAEIRRVTASEDVAVLATGEHLCMSMRGVRTPALMTSSSLSGVFKEDAATRAEFFELTKR